MSLSINIKRVSILALSLVFALGLVSPVLAIGQPSNGTPVNGPPDDVSAAEQCENHTSDDIALPKVESANGDEEVNDVDFSWSGDPGVLTVTNNNDTTATISWCAKGGANFSDGSMITGEQTTVLAAGESVEVTFGTEISYFLVYSIVVADPEPEVYFFQFDKEWVGDVEGIDLDELGVVFYADGDFDWELGVDAPVEVVPGETTLTNVREEVTGLPAQCTSTADVLPLETLTAPVDEDNVYGDDNLFTLTVTNTIECEEGVVLGDDDEKKEGEILAATTVRSLPETGSSASIVASIAAIVATSLAMASSLVKGAFVRFTA